MRRIRIMGLWLVAAVGLGAIGAGSAAALPEVGRCVAKAGTGAYKDSNCTETKEVHHVVYTFKGGAFPPFSERARTNAYRPWKSSPPK